MITINIKTSTEGKFTVDVENCEVITVLELKKVIAEKSNIAADQQRLIYSGKVLKDADVLSTYKLDQGHTIHLVKGGGASSANRATVSGPVSPAAAVSTTTPSATTPVTTTARRSN